MVSTSRVVEILSTIGTEFTLVDVSLKLGVSQATAKRYINELLRSGFITARNGKYTVTEKGLLLLEITRIKDISASSDQAYVFTDEKGTPLVLRVDSISKLYIVVKYGLVPENVLKHHLEKGYLSKWILEVLGAKILAEKINSVKSVGELLALLEQYLAA